MTPVVLASGGQPWAFSPAVGAPADPPPSGIICAVFLQHMCLVQHDVAH
jgi:hypothetical protein